MRFESERVICTCNLSIMTDIDQIGKGLDICHSVYRYINDRRLYIIMAIIFMCEITKFNNKTKKKKKKKKKHDVYYTPYRGGRIISPLRIIWNLLC